MGTVTYFSYMVFVFGCLLHAGYAKPQLFTRKGAASMSPSYYDKGRRLFYPTDLRSFESSRNARKLESSVIVEPIFEGEQHFVTLNEPRIKYPLTPPQIKYRVGIISDLDRESESLNEHGKWDSYLKEGNLILQQSIDDPSKSNVFIEWDESDNGLHKITSGLSYAGRGMELSILNVFNGKLISCDDQTGVIYELVRHNFTTEITPTPWAILADGNFTGNQGFKCEWATVKDGFLYVGGYGTDDYFIPGIPKRHHKFVKKISPFGEVMHLDWSQKFGKMAAALDVHFPGYVVHEAAGWSDSLQKWMFMPRKVSKEQYSEDLDEKKGSNVILLADENFDDILVGHVGQLVATHGFSSFKWIPGTNDQMVVALKCVEMKETNTQMTYIMAFDLQGNILLPETKVDDHKYEGIEFI